MVSLLHKKGVPRETAYYRPISLMTKVMRMLYERCLLDKLDEGVVLSIPRGIRETKRNPGPDRRLAVRPLEGQG